MTTKQYSISVTSQNLPPTETINQVIDNLNYLTNIMNTAFDTISSKIQSQRHSISDLQNRINKCNKLQEIVSKHPNKSTKISSYDTWPEKIATNDEQLLNTQEIKPINRGYYNISKEKRNETPSSVDTLQLFDKLNKSTAIENNDKEIGLGSLPDYVTSVNDCLLFNTTTNPYIRYNSNTYNLIGKQNKNKNKNINKINENQNNIYDAPISIVNKQGINNIDDDYKVTYEPVLDNIPQFKTQQNLNGLDKVALDQELIIKNETYKIAPSAIQFNQLPSIDAYYATDFNTIQNKSHFSNNEKIVNQYMKKSINTSPQQPLSGNKDTGIVVENKIKKKSKMKKQMKTKTKTDQNKQKRPKRPKRKMQIKKEMIKEQKQVKQHKPAAPISKKNRSMYGIGTRPAGFLDQIHKGISLKKQARKTQPKKEFTLHEHLKNQLEIRKNLMNGNINIKKSNNLVNNNSKHQNNNSKHENNKSNLISKTDSNKNTNNDFSKNDETGLDLKNLPSSFMYLDLEVNSPSSGSDNDDWKE